MKRLTNYADHYAPRRHTSVIRDDLMLNINCLNASGSHPCSHDGTSKIPCSLWIYWRCVLKWKAVEPLNSQNGGMSTNLATARTTSPTSSRATKLHPAPKKNIIVDVNLRRLTNGPRISPFGSNLNTPTEQLNSALEAISALPNTELKSVSGFYQSKTIRSAGST